MDGKKIETPEKIPASRKLSRDDAFELAKKAKVLYVAKGKKLSEFKPGGKPSDEMIDAMLGPTGNLRAPCIVSGSTLIVGFNEELYEDKLS